MIGILFKVITATFPFVKEMLFGRSATGRTRMISFLIICNLALAISFFTTAKLTTNLYIAERKHREDITQLKTALESATDAIANNNRTSGSIVEIVSAYTLMTNQLRQEVTDLKTSNTRLEIELATCRPPKK